MKFLCAGLFLLLLNGCGAGEPEVERPEGVADSSPLADSPPNIVILFADDLGYGDLSTYGNMAIKTPNLDALASEGQRWTDFYVAAPVCSPSRAALLTGKLPNRTGLYGERLRVLFPNDSVGIPATETTLAEALGSVGYETAIVGKWHLGDAPESYPTRHGFDYWFGLPYSNDMDWAVGPDFSELLQLSVAGQNEAVQRAVVDRRQLLFDPKSEYWNLPLLRSKSSQAGHTAEVVDEVVERPADQTSLTRRYTEEAISFVSKPRDGPFLLYVPYAMPHVPLFRGPDFVGVSDGGYYGDVIEEIDWSAGEIRRALESQGLAENTLLVFTSDNGPWLSMAHHGGSAGPLNNGKGTTFDGGMRVPAIFWWPGTITPAVVSGIGSTMDLFATALQLAQAPASPDVDGMDLSAVLLEGADSPRQTVAYYRAGELQAFRQGPYKLQLVAEGAYGLPPDRVVHDAPVLFHLEQDPGETLDIAASNPQIVTQLLDAVARHQAGLVSLPPAFDERLSRLGAQ